MENTNGGRVPLDSENSPQNKDNSNDGDEVDVKEIINDGDEVDVKEIIKDWDKEYLAIEKITSSKDSTTCTYDKGYHTQEVFACLTCFNDLNKYGALCVGCSLSCHRGHDVISLYFKRHIKCDCGNSAFLNECKLVQERDYANTLNEYNHNYEGKYCYCNEEDDENEMIQCFICEDWYHKRHLNFNGDLTGKDEADLICHNCFKNPCLDFIIDYSFEGLVLLPFCNDNTHTSQSFNQTPRKAKRTSEEAFSIGNRNELTKEGAECSRSIVNDEIKRSNKRVYDAILEGKIDVMISLKVLESKLCHCVKCSEIYSKNKLPFNSNDFYVEWNKRIPFESRINSEINEETEENKTILEKSNLMKAMNSKINELDVEKQVELSMVNKEFYEQFKKYIMSIKPEEGKELVITYEHVQDFLSQFNKILQK